MTKSFDDPERPTALDPLDGADQPALELVAGPNV